MKPYNIVIEFNVPNKPNSPALCMLSLSLQDDTDPAEVVKLFQQELFATCAFPRSTGTYMPAPIAILKAAKRVQDTFHCESFMLEANGKLSLNLC